MVRPLALCALALLATGVGRAADDKPAAKPAASAEELYKKVFGAKRQAARTQKADLPVFFDGAEIGQIPGMVGLDPADTGFDLTALASLLIPLVQPKALDDLKTQADPSGWTKPAQLSRQGIQVAYEPTTQVLQVTVPAIARQRRELSVMERGAAARSYVVVPQADFSAQMNMRAAADYLSVPDGLGESGLGPLSVVYEPAVNWKGWVAEGNVYYREDGKKRWARGPVKLLHDFQASGIRAQLGDLSTPVTGSQVGKSVLGLSVAREFSIRPYDLVQPAGSRDFVLENPSVVEVLVNGRPSRSFRLQPGPYNLNSFPGASGTNDVQIRITDGFGREQVIDFPFFFDSQLLGAGVQEFGYTLGLPSSVRDDIYTYDTADPMLTAYQRVGVTDQLTIGLGTQIDRTETNVTGEVLFSTSLGTFGVEPAAYLRRKPNKDADPTDKGRKAGLAGTLRYRSYDNGADSWANGSVTAQLSWYQKDYRNFGSNFDSDTKLDMAARVTRPLLETLTLSLGGRYRDVRGTDSRDNYSIDLSLRQRLWRTGSLDVTFSHGRDSLGERDTGVYVTSRFFLDGGRQSLGASIDTIAGQQRLDWRYQSMHPVDALSARLELTNQYGSAGDQIQGGLSYVNQRFETSVQHNLVRRSLDAHSELENRTQMTAATALAFADGHGAVTRPISNSFAIIVPHPRLKGRDVGVDPVDDHYLAETDWLGVPVVPNISAYLVRPLLLDVPDAPANYDLGDDRPAVQPGYRAGTIVTIGTDAVASVTGQLLTADGTPAALLSGVLRPLDSSKGAKDLPFFTNRKGQFRVESVRPGRWALSIFGVTMVAETVTVPADADGEIKLPPIHLPAP
ncbi:fimbrial biogenesis outer membrane usher protein [Niveispirillum sp. BGYR6]|uniref:fimbrial biogenesis outer membrane usher protein n=1 Tax=Niveispirillum sp. BGYR6 TaxID=2971249 RepID=UPI0022B998F3|nr:fimbrial biogenesis outer membrane usher protein [Niveispirillum sp. BGYR6]MDG5496698.1 fimbrial biogenesis outer membrane usher protein [Niveispirillum sp. BGYR6]